MRNGLKYLGERDRFCGKEKVRGDIRLSKTRVSENWKQGYALDEKTWINHGIYVHYITDPEKEKPKPVLDLLKDGTDQEYWILHREY